MSLPRRRVLLIDTSVLLEIIKVPFEADRHDEVVELFQRHMDSGIELRLPTATVLETGAHVRRIKNGNARRECARSFVRFLTSALDDEAPWSFLQFTWSREVIQDLLAGTGHGYSLEQSLADGIFEIGDLMIVEEWRRTRASGLKKVVDVDVWTLDTTLRAVIDSLRDPADR